ncbi:DUF169 domain-containing protein [Methanobacterium paludis]|uniref:DUF169 domain-containing protein n=1 Tax=Methanobacterium paludis (strain DSM 25820 / JCM 18151 / SWAN1) TaxID=868131 RepID=F6D218_METPW|nr:DUF169 domain-containing protein [Methanobacterium paludis]AEG17307.1 protein of unknown function DUF169 [Methanobacterium paludis]
MNYEKIVKELDELLKLKGSPVAVKLIKNADELPAGYSKMPEKKRHCEFVQNARLKGDEGYATSKEHLCKGGAGVMGIGTLPESVANGSMYHKLGNFKTAEGALETVNDIPKSSKEHYASIYSPLESAKFEPDVVVLVLTPKQALRITQASLHLKGGRVSSDYSGLQSVCADAVVAVKERGVANMTLGCNGSRKNAGIADGEVIMGIPPENLEEIVDALRTFKEKWG